jgi:high-affinity iron transporter
MLGTALLVFREVLEAALIISIVCAATRGVPRRERWVGAGIVLGLVGSMIVAAFAEAIGQAVSGVGQEVFNATVLLAAVVMIAWHAIWMASHGRELAAQSKALGSSVAAGTQPMTALLIVVMIAVLREGSETVLFVYAQAATGASVESWLTGVVVGIAAGAAVGYALYAGLLRIPMRYFFSATNWLLLLVAAGMAAQAAQFLVQADVLPALAPQLWDTSAVLSDTSLLGQTLHTLIGYDPRPTGIQMLFYVVTAAVIIAGMKLTAKSAGGPSRKLA